MMEDIVYQLALCFQTNYGYPKIRTLLEHFGSAKAIFLNEKSPVNKPSRHHKPLHFELTPELLRNVNNEREKMLKENINFCFYGDSLFPKRLLACNDAPFYFFYKGNNDFHFSKSMAMVGTRNSTAYGEKCVKKIIEDLTGTDIVVISGLAEGIDTHSHQYALDCNLRTIAVMGTGFNRIYPPTNRKLFDDILANNGTVITEFPYHTLPERFNFPIRNRLIAGLSDATIVVETALRGGSMITANIANSYNKDVFAVPGSIFQKTSEGCHFLIKKKLASSITCGTDILEMMNWDTIPHPTPQLSLFHNLNEIEIDIVTFINQAKEISIDEIIARFNQYSVSKVTAFLLNLEFKNVIECKPGKIYRVIE